MKEIAFFLDNRLESPVQNLLEVLSSQKSARLRLIKRGDAGRYDFTGCAAAILSDPIGQEMTAAMKQARKACVPSLGLEDGIIEYEHCWKKRPDRYRPLITDKIAVFGNYTKRILMSWGIEGNRIEVTGCPRFDALHGVNKSLPAKSRILLTCANTPFVDEKTREEFRTSFLEIAEKMEMYGFDYFIRLNKEKTLSLFGKDSVVFKRLRQDNSALFNRVLKKLKLNQRTIMQDISEASAVITTPSTVVLEAMAMGRPVAIINYSGETIYHRTPWEISSPHHIKTVVQELLDPAPPKMLFQNQLFSDYVFFDGSASKRIADIVFKMIKV